jgi:hypothetical protein
MGTGSRVPTINLRRGRAALFPSPLGEGGAALRRAQGRRRVGTRSFAEIVGQGFGKAHGDGSGSEAARSSHSQIRTGMLKLCPGAAASNPSASCASERMRWFARKALSSRSATSARLHCALRRAGPVARPGARGPCGPHDVLLRRKRPVALRKRSSAASDPRRDSQESSRGPQARSSQGGPQGPRS